LSIAKSQIGVTNYSGVAIESADFGKPTIILHPYGEMAFSNLIGEGKAVYLSDQKQLKTLVNQLINKPLGTTSDPELSKQTFQKLIVQNNSNVL